MYNSKCLDCHSEIKSGLNSGRGYHSSPEVKGKDCWSCHSEHHGRNFQIIRFDEKKFEHEKTGYKLEGAHTRLECNKCHNASNIKDDKLKKRSKTFLGLSTNCLTCHKDEHNSTLDKNCSNCHTFDSFKGAEKFQHKTARFQLTGKHIDVDCSKCHKKETASGVTFTRYKPLSFANCLSCHQDPHQNKFGDDCQKCHSTSSFQTVKTGAFDHNLTKFPLIGKHRAVDCSDCHKGGISKKLLFGLCTDCHADGHKKQFVTENTITDCRNCHSTDGFSPSNFGIAEHNKKGFTLDGAHLSIPCFACHYKEGEWKFRPLKKECILCHVNIHGNELSNEFLPENNCLKCHNTSDWKTVNFNHDLTKFPLSGKHAAAECRQCHYKKEESVNNGYIFKSVKQDCASCHTDIHFGQFAARGNSGCKDCHSFNGWKPATFNHSETKFPLTGAHEKLNCSECHKTSGSQSNIYIQYKLTDFKCITCHK